LLSHQIAESLPWRHLGFVEEHPTIVTKVKASKKQIESFSGKKNRY